MKSPWYLAGSGTYEEFCASYDLSTVPIGTVNDLNELLLQAMTNMDSQARLAIANRLLDDGADASWVDTGSDRVNVFHVLWGRERDRDVEGEATLVARLLDEGADINWRSPRFGLPLTMLMSDAATSREYLRAVFAVVTTHTRPDLTAPIDGRRELTVGQGLAMNRFGFMRDEVLAYAAASGQDIDLMS